jgi:hypothetical protein
VVVAILSLLLAVFEIPLTIFEHFDYLRTFSREHPEISTFLKVYLPYVAFVVFAFLVLAALVRPDEEQQGDQVQDSGFQEMRWFDNIDWEYLFSSCNRVELFFTSNTTWTKANITRIRDFLSKRDNHMTIVIREPDLASLTALAARFGEDPRKRYDGIIETAKMFLDAFEELPTGPRGELKLLLHPRDATHSYYRFGDVVLFVPYKLRPGRAPGEIPVLYFTSSGMFYREYLEKDFSHLVDSAKQVTRSLFEKPQH